VAVDPDHQAVVTKPVPGFGPFTDPEEDGTEIRPPGNRRHHRLAAPFLISDPWGCRRRSKKVSLDDIRVCTRLQLCISRLG